MTYTINIPDPTHYPADDVGPMQTNTNQLNTQFGTEHVALTVGSGKHKYVTLARNPGPPAPAATEYLLQQVNAGGKSSVQILEAGPIVRSIPLRTMLKPPVTQAIPAGTGTRNVVDFATINLGANSSGTLFLYDNSDFRRTIFCTYVWAGGVLSLPGSTGPGFLKSGTTFNAFDNAGTMLQLVVNGLAAGTTVTLIITESVTT